MKLIKSSPALVTLVLAILLFLCGFTPVAQHEFDIQTHDAFLLLGASFILRAMALGCLLMALSYEALYLQIPTRSVVILCFAHLAMNLLFPVFIERIMSQSIPHQANYSLADIATYSEEFQKRTKQEAIAILSWFLVNILFAFYYFIALIRDAKKHN
ncbi:MAG: hypothetical protein JST90_00330 [Bacteroidetes bacterium]|nr:hypothetical protein [Bacteroidota bacterium]